MNRIQTIPGENQLDTLGASLSRITDVTALAAEWRELEINAESSFFISWSWIGPWLQMVLNANVELYLYRCKNGDVTIALGILSRTTITRRKIFRSTILALNETPCRDLDMVIEYNDLLVRRGFETPVRARFLNDLMTAPTKWDEVMLNGTPESAWKEIASGNAILKPIIDEQRKPWATDISAIDGDMDKLLAPLSRNRRWQIRRSFKAFQEDGELEITTPATSDQALTFFAEMGALHTARWNRVGEAGSFANPSWVEFHRGVIREGFDRDEIQLLKICTGEQPIGYIYSFIWRGTVYMLQTGFAQEEDNTKRPGFVSHCLAMQYNSRRNANVYDFMCGDAEYKRVLGQESSPLIWGRLQRRTVTSRIENRLASLIRQLRKFKAPFSISDTKDASEPPQAPQ